MNINQDIQAIKKTIIETRRDFHKHPELSFQEFRTSKIVAEKLESFGIKVKKNIGKLGAIVSLKAKKFDEKIQEFGHKLAMHIAATNPISIDQDDLDTNILEKEKKIISEELKNSGKNATIVEKILKGKLEKFKQENTLINQTWVIDPPKKVKDIMVQLDKENGLTVKNFVRYKIGE